MRTRPIDLAPLLLIALLAVCVSGCCSSRVPKKYALLISTETADTLPTEGGQLPDPNQANNSEFWSDLLLTYCTLSRNGFSGENIFVLYGNGTDHDSGPAGYGQPYCDGSSKITDLGLADGRGFVVKDNICNALCCLAVGQPATQRDGKCQCLSPADSNDGPVCSQLGLPRLKTCDSLFVWLKGHGATVNCETYLKLARGNSLSDEELARMIASIPARRRALVLETCSSGGWLDELRGNSMDHLMKRGSVAAASSGNPDVIADCRERSFPSFYSDKSATVGTDTATEILHGRFTYWMNAALRGEAPSGTALDADADRNRLVSILEVIDTAGERIAAENQTYNLDPQASGLGGQQHPGISARTGVAPCVFIALPDPSEYCRCLRRIPSR